MDPLHHPRDVVVTADGSWTLAHAEHGESYHSRHGALAEATGLYVQASGIAQRWRLAGVGTRVLDVGLGLGYNAIATIEAWWADPAPGPLTILSLEVDAALVEALRAGTGAWQGNWPASRLALAQALGRGPIPHPTAASLCHWQLALGDALHSTWAGAFDCIWQDPFSPAKNPDMWSTPWFRRLRQVAATEAVLMTYSVARAVRAALTEAGWQVSKIPTGTGHKRHWLRAVPAVPGSSLV